MSEKLIEDVSPPKVTEDVGIVVLVSAGESGESVEGVTGKKRVTNNSVVVSDEQRQQLKNLLAKLKNKYRNLED